MRIRFGDCVLDGETRELQVAGRTVHVSPKGFQFLELLLANRPRALSKNEIHEKLWPGTFVSDGTLTSLLAEIRSTIGDDAREPRFIRTVQRFGYAFSGPVQEETSGPLGRKGRPQSAYRLFWGPREIALEEGETVLGRDPEATAFIDHTSVSRRHARITIADGIATIEDLGSKNGTFVREERIETASRIADGDAIRLGSLSMTYRVFSLSGSTETAERK
jgi:DNA-binding winged helix-turn-helix (wHTH) protein